MAQTELPFRHYWNGESYPILVLDNLPASVRPMRESDIRDGVKFFYEVEVGTYVGKYFWDIVTPESRKYLYYKLPKCWIRE